MVLRAQRLAWGAGKARAQVRDIRLCIFAVVAATTFSHPPMPSARPAQRASKPAPLAGTSHTITELALEFDITARAIRFYEDMGLLAPTRAGRNRVYSQRDRTRLKLTLRGKRLGLSLLEIKQLVDMYDSPSDTTQQLTAFLGVLGEHRRQLEQQREDLEITLTEITQHEARCKSLLGAPAGSKARKRR